MRPDWPEGAQRPGGGGVRRQLQAHRHDPANGEWGDCHRTCVAMLLGLPRDDVPHWAAEAKDDTDLFWALQEDWLRARGLAMASFVANDLDALLSHMDAHAAGVPYILGGRSALGVHHSVVGLGGRVVADPSLDDTGIVGPCDDGYYWVSLLCAAAAVGEGEAS